MREIRVQKPGNYLPFISGDATSGDVTSGDVTILTNHPQILIELSPYTTNMCFKR
jgi:hypothetical protein